MSNMFGLERAATTEGAAEAGVALQDPGKRHLVKWLNASLVLGLTIVLAVVAIAVLAPWIYPGDPREMIGSPGTWPFEDSMFPLGTDALGRDVAAQLAHGARVSLMVGIAAALLGLIIGITIGAIGGYSGGWIDGVLVRVMELFQTVPPFLLVVVIVAIGNSSSMVIALAIGISSWPTVARLVRAQFRTLRSADYVLAARSLGYSTTRIVIGEILPNALAPIVVTATIMIANAILVEAGLSFLNMGDTSVVSWGGMIGDGRDVLRTEWFLTAIPGAAISITVLALNLFGNGLNDALNPRSIQS
jgi:peptide/nickel transport system permease protein